jgi:anti-sigma factor RsiW
MTEQDRDIANDRALWLSVSRAWAEHGLGERPGPVILAAYLDDRLEPADQARVEAWMAAAPEILDLVAAARAASQAGSAPAPEQVVARARALRFGPAGKRFSRAGWLDAVFAPLRIAAVSGAVAAVILAAVAGFELGRAGYLHMAALDGVLSEDLGLGFDQDDLI